MEKYLYLTYVEWSDSWVNGGDVPISVASTYIRGVRDGIYTPDENLIHDSIVDLKSLSPMIHIATGAQVKGLSIIGSSFNGRKIPNIINASYYNEDGLILSFCNEFSPEIARKMGKKCCEKILDIEHLRKVIDKQLGKKGKMKNCQYTDSHQRNHYLKSHEDKWQNEYRLFWKGTENKLVTLPPGIAEFIMSFDE